MAKVQLRLDEILENRGKTAYWLAKELGMGHGNLYVYRKNRVKAMNLELLARMCELLECDIADLMVLVDEKAETKRKSKSKG